MGGVVVISTTANVSSYLRRAATIMARDDVERWARLTKALGDRAAYIEIEGEGLTLRLNGKHLQVRRGRRGSADGIGFIDRQTILDLVEGRCLLLDALYAGRVVVRADPETLLALSEALSTFVEASVRSRALQAVWESYRAET